MFCPGVEFAGGGKADHDGAGFVRGHVLRDDQPELLELAPGRRGLLKLEVVIGRDGRLHLCGGLGDVLP